MFKYISAVFLLITATPIWAEGDVLAEYRWAARPVLLFADNPRDPRLIQQLDMFANAQRDLEERDLIVIVDTDPESALRDQFHPRDFQFVLVDKEGRVAYRKPDPVPMRELTRVVDRIPLRLEEMRRN